MGQMVILTDDEAWEIAVRAREKLIRAERSACVCVVNRHGETLISFSRGPARPFTANIARLKAVQSARTGRRTRFIRDRVAAGDWGLGFAGMDPADYCGLAGGVPVYDDNGDLLGGCGVSNLHEDQDEEVSSGAVEAAGFVSDLA